MMVWKRRLLSTMALLGISSWNPVPTRQPYDILFAWWLSPQVSYADTGVVDTPSPTSLWLNGPPNSDLLLGVPTSSKLSRAFSAFDTHVLVLRKWHTRNVANTSEALNLHEFAVSIRLQEMSRFGCRTCVLLRYVCCMWASKIKKKPEQPH